MMPDSLSAAMDSEARIAERITAAGRCNEGPVLFVCETHAADWAGEVPQSRFVSEKRTWKCRHGNMMGRCPQFRLSDWGCELRVEKGASGMSGSTELSVYERCGDPLAAVKEMGLAIAKSRMFGCESVEQGMVFAWECFSRKCSPLSLTETYHVIDGKLAMRADAMLARFIEQGGRHVIIERSPDRAAVQLLQDGETQAFSFTWEEAQAEGLPNGKNGIKTNWSTPRRRMQMLWARVVSDGVRAMAPQVCAGAYTPEDFGHSIDNQDDAEPAADSTPAVVTTVEVTAAAPPVVKTEPAAASPATVVEPAARPITREQKDAIRKLVNELGAQDSLEAALKKRGVSSINSLTYNQAGEIVAKLTAAKQKQELAVEVAGQTKLPDPTTEAALAGPCTQAQIAIAKQLIEEINQLQPGIVSKIKAKLKDAGLAKISDLSMRDCDSLLAQLGKRNLDAFFAAELAKPKAPAGN
jgi:hypothetical protein